MKRQDGLLRRQHTCFLLFQDSGGIQTAVTEYDDETVAAVRRLLSR